MWLGDLNSEFFIGSTNSPITTVGLHASAQIDDFIEGWGGGGGGGIDQSDWRKL